MITSNRVGRPVPGAVLDRGDHPAPLAEPAVDVANLTKRYGAVTALAGVSFRVERGEVFGLLGPNGAGKSTTLEILEGLRVPDSGSVRILGRDLPDHLRHGRGQVGVQLQGTALPQRLTAQEVLELFAALYPRRRPVEELIATFGLGEFRRRIVRKLSGGQQQRLALAREHFTETAIRVVVEGEGARPPELDGLAAVTRLARVGDALVLYSTDPPRTLAELLAFGERAGVRFEGIEIRPATLEDVFLKLTGRELSA